MSLILVVEDQDYLRKLTERMLKQGGHDVLAVGSGKEAVGVCKETTVDLVITDLAMPDMDGIELIRSLRNSHPDLPILAMSGTFTGHFLKIATTLGAVGTLEKPFRQGDLLAMVNESTGKQTA